MKHSTSLVIQQGTSGLFACQRIQSVQLEFLVDSGPKSNQTPASGQTEEHVYAREIKSTTLHPVFQLEVAACQHLEQH